LDAGGSRGADEALEFLEEGPGPLLHEYLTLTSLDLIRAETQAIEEDLSLEGAPHEPTEGSRELPPELGPRKPEGRESRVENAESIG
jgi:hypothetical protein